VPKSVTKQLSEHAQEAMNKASALSRELGESCMSTGTLIYGLTSDHLSLGNRIFNDIKIYPEMFRDHLKKLPVMTEPGDRKGFHPLVKTAIDRSKICKQKLGGGSEIQTDHLLIALLSLREGSAYECMREFSVEPREISTEIVEAMGFEFDDCPSW